MDLILVFAFLPVAAIALLRWTERGRVPRRAVELESTAIVRAIVAKHRELKARRGQQ